ncbi:hypothetical protein VNI00_005854 [Paramarasmius palmivorus]|uniref:C2H2-type domain-containing protein n=1 Tax=Paramarasmius palmivorus TaxID=297713 RepID=A0AAW0DFS7_9AGAR
MSSMKRCFSSSQQREIPYCSLCDQYFHNKAQLHQHFEDTPTHPRCKTCKRSFLNKNSLRSHYVLSSRHHYCRDCNKNFKSASGLRVHLEHHPAHIGDEDDYYDLDPVKYPSGWEDAQGAEQDRLANKEDPISTNDSEPTMSRVEVTKKILAMKQRMANKPAKKFAQSCPVCLSTPKSMSAARCGHLFCTSKDAQSKEALEILSSSPDPSSQGYNAYLAAWSSSKNKSNQPPLMNIPPQEDPLLHYLASRIMRNGNRTRASRTISRTLLHLHAWTRQPPLPILRQAIFALAPAARVASQTHGAKIIQQPMPLSEKKGIYYAVKWLLEEVEGRNGGPTLEERLAREIILLVKGESKALDKKATFHKLAMSNRYVA